MLSEEKCLVAVQIPKKSRKDEILVAYFVKGVIKEKGAYKPVSNSKIYSAFITNGTIEEQGDWVQPQINYPILIDRKMFRLRKVFIIRPESHLEMYVQQFYQHGRPQNVKPMPPNPTDEIEHSRLSGFMSRVYDGVLRRFLTPRMNKYLNR